MAERIKVTVRPSEAHPDVLTVQDAMRQVLDVFSLLAGENDEVVWRLVKASANSPFWAEGEATSLVPEVDVSVVARRQRTTFVRNMKALTAGRQPPDWRGTKKAKIAQDLLVRNFNGVGLTAIETSADDPVLVTPKIAEAAYAAITAPDAGEDVIPAPKARDEYGSIDGQLESVSTDYTKPAVQVIERHTGRTIPCRLDEDLASRLERERSFKDVWEGRPVRVRGIVRYDESGDILRVYASEVELLPEPREMTLQDIHDPNFTDGLSTSEYLERLREGALGT